ncbi:MAM domain-containing protein 2 [Saguinus oedipus]|uniref:MAM domain-containing protein 2 n=1 Tax=Saguinus oedipus TaxID=9490 RepID=A0ABQ9WD47_SAGOE|nr:MAM domain-containing protein 2 [Saguinus oedipus]
MYGGGTGLLSVYLKKEEDSEESLLWRRRGEQSISWLRALIEYSCERQHQDNQAELVAPKHPSV